MEDIEKLKCNESVEMSDGEQIPDEKPKKKKRRKREIDMIFDDDDEESAGEAPQSRKPKFCSPGPNSPGFVREPRSCVLKASQKRKPLSRLLEQLLRNLEKRDPNQFFAWPVNDNFAPNYSNIIRKPMDFSTMKQKIDDNAYRSLNCFINDFKLICNNAMKYNKPGTVYHKAAKRLLHVGLKQLTPAKLRPLATILTYMYEIPIRELGFDIGKMDMPLRTYGRKSVQQKILHRGGSATGSDEGKSGEESEPAPEPRDDDAIKIKMAEAREKHRQRLAKKAFPRMDEEGKTTLRLVTDTVAQDGADKPVTLGQLIGKLTQGTGTLQTYREDRRNLVKGVKPLYYGPFSSYAPSYDSCFATLTKDESHLLYHTLNAELGMGNEETLRFAPDSPWASIYDMELLFPEKKPPESSPQPAVELNKVKVDIEELRTLSELGIDTEFLNEVEEEVPGSQKDYGIQNALQHNYDLLARLEREQRDRLSSSVPAHLALVRGATGGEREAARGVAACLRSMLARVPPRHLATLTALRHAMGVTLSHLDTPMSVDELEDVPATEELHHTLDIK